MYICTTVMLIGFLAGRFFSERVSPDHGASMLWVMCGLCGLISVMLFWEPSPASFFPGVPAAFSCGQLLGVLLPRRRQP